MTPDQLQQAAKDLQSLSKKNGSTSERGIEQDDGSIIILRSTDGGQTEQFQLSPEERHDLGWPTYEADQA